MYKVFFAEDETAVRDLIIRTIDWQEQGIVFCGTAGDGTEALPLILRNKPDILITDIKMPDMDGLELARLARQSLPQLQVIIISGYSDFNYMREAIHLGVTDYVLKPVTPLKLIQALSRTIRILTEEADQEKTRHLVNMSNEDSSDGPETSGILEGMLESQVDEEALWSFLSGSAAQDVESFVSELLRGYQKTRRETPGMEIYYIYDVITASAKICRRIGLEPHFLKEYSNAAERCHGEEGFRELFGELFRRILCMRDAMSDSKLRLVKKAQAFMDGNYRDPDLSLTSVAEHVGITPNYLSLLFSREVGESFSEYLNQIRIRQAANLLKNTDSSVHDIAHRIGFADAFYFSKVFKKIMGMSPREFRRL